MKSAALLIGFEYVAINDWKSLPGIPVDLYQAYNYSLNITRNITVFTDVNKDYRTGILQKAIIEGYVDSGLLSFIEDTKEQNTHTLFATKTSNGYKDNNFETIIINTVKDVNRLFIYYTGHAKNGHLILPDNTHIALTHIRDIISSSVNNDCQIVVILDCCQSNGMELPYLYDSVYKLQTISFEKVPIICLSSSDINNDSSATGSGSIFSRNLFKYLNNHSIITIRDLSKNIMIGITCSYPEKMLWSWFGNGGKNDNKNDKTNIDIFYDKNSSIIIIKLRNCQRTIETSASIEDYIRYLSKLNYRNATNIKIN